MASPTAAPQSCGRGVESDEAPHHHYTARGYRLTPRWLMPHPDLRCPGLACIPAHSQVSGPARLGFFCIWDAFWGMALNPFDIPSALLPPQKKNQDKKIQQ